MGEFQSQYDIDIKRERYIRFAQMYGSKMLFNPCCRCGEIKYYHDNLNHPYFKNNLEMLEWLEARKEAAHV